MDGDLSAFVRGRWRLSFFVISLRLNIYKVKHRRVRREDRSTVTLVWSS